METDLINSLFTFGGGLFAWRNAWVLFRERKVCGVSRASQGFFTLWGIWTLVFYSQLNHWSSFAAALVIVSANIVWVALAFRFRPAPI